MGTGDFAVQYGGIASLSVVIPRLTTVTMIIQWLTLMVGALHDTRLLSLYYGTQVSYKP